MHDKNAPPAQSPPNRLAASRNEQQTMHLIRDVLDNRLLDRHDRPMGRVDGLILRLTDPHAQPELVQIHTGLPTLASRLHPRLGRLLRTLAYRLHRPRPTGSPHVHAGFLSSPTRIPWSRVRDVGIDVRLDLDADRTTALAWEHAIRDRFTRHLPGAR
jgi:hypothetical protein